MRSWQVFTLVALLIINAGGGGLLLARNSRPSAIAAVQTAKAGDLSSTMRLDDAALGARVIDITVRDTAGRPADVGAVRLRFAMAEMDMGNSDVVAQPLGAGHFQARGSFFTMAGRWSVE